MDGHNASLAELQLLVDDIRTFFPTLRTYASVIDGCGRRERTVAVGEARRAPGTI